MTVRLAPIALAELAEVNALIFRSKAHWGYDAAFMEACREELLLSPDDLAKGPHIAARGGAVLGVARVEPEGAAAELHSLFVDPAAMGRGVGKALFHWAVEAARGAGAARLAWDADPFAAPFYEAVGAVKIGETPSPTRPGRILPRFAFAL